MCSDMNVEDEEWTQHALIECERKKCISKVLSIEREDAVPKGDNYASEMHRLKIKVVLNSGDIEERHVIYKALPKAIERRIGLKRSGLFSTETKMYTDVLPELERILKKCDPTAEPLWPEFYGAKARNEGYLLQDLKPLGYSMANRFEGLDLEHSILVLKTLGKFHALGAVAIQQENIQISDFDTMFFQRTPEMSHMIFLMAFKDLAKVLVERWKGEWVEYGERLRKSTETFSTRLVDSLKRDDSKFNTMIHGDCWLNNFLFRRNANGDLENVRLVDFQLSFHGGPGIDIQYFFQTSLKDGLHKEKEKELLQIYHESLVEHLKMFGFQGDVPTLQDIEESNEKARYYGYAVGLALKPIMLLPSKEVPDLDKMAKDFMEDPQSASNNIFEYDGKEFIETIKRNLRNASQGGFL